MKFQLISIIGLLLLSSCKRNESLQSKIDWENELIGIGFAGIKPDSLHTVFEYYPCKKNQPDFLTLNYLYRTKISGDTISIPNFELNQLFWPQQYESKPEEVSLFKINHENGLFVFTKISGKDYIPQKVYFQKSPCKFPTGLIYDFISGSNIWGGYKIELDNANALKVHLKIRDYGSGSYTLEQDQMTEVDKKFIYSYLNLSCKKRYDTISLRNTIICWTHTNDYLV